MVCFDEILENRNDKFILFLLASSISSLVSSSDFSLLMVCALDSSAENHLPIIKELLRKLLRHTI